MSLLEDVFLEDEAGEAQELERIIEGDEYDERPRTRSDSGENSEKEDEAEEDKRRVDPTSAKTKRVIRNPRFVLNPARLTGPRGMQVLPEHFKDFKFKGKGHEREDLDLLLKNLEHWAYRLYPKFKFEDCLKKIETLGKKSAVSVHLTKLRLGMITSEETVVQRDSSDDEAAPADNVGEDEFDKLLQQQIEIARATPGPGSVKKTPFSDRPPLMPKATSSPSINDEQRERMLLNRKKAEERRLARLKQNTSYENTINISEHIIDDSSIRMKRNMSAIDSDDERSVTEKDGNNEIGNTRKKVNMSVIDSVEEIDNASNKSGNGNKSVTIELDTESVTKTVGDLGTLETVEINDGFAVSNSYVPAKKHNRFTKDSSDDGGALVINEQVTINVEEHYKNSESAKNKALQRCSDEDVYPIAVDGKSHKINKSNAIDSSDAEDEIVMNESIDVDIHSNKPFEDSNIASKDNNTCNGENNKMDNYKDGNVNTSKNIQNDVFDNLKASEENDVALKDVIEKQASNEKNNIIDLQNSIFDEKSVQDAEVQADSKQENEFLAKNPVDNENNEAQKPIEVLSEIAKTNEVGNRVLSESIAIEEMMDVDISDDF